MEVTNIFHNLGDEGKKYVNDVLIDGSLLSQTLLATIDDTDGVFLALAPPDAEMRELKDFANSILPQTNPFYQTTDERGSEFLVQEKSTASKDLAKLIFDFLVSSNQNICVFEDSNASPDDPGLPAQERKLLLDRAVFYLLTSEDRDQARVLRTINESTSWRFVCVCTTIPSQVHQRFLQVSSMPLSMNDVKILAQNAHLICVGAYDGESYIIWQKN